MEKDLSINEYVAISFKPEGGQEMGMLAQSHVWALRSFVLRLSDLGHYDKMIQLQHGKFKHLFA